MDIDEFQQKAVESVALPKSDPTALAHRAFGLLGEAGQVAHILKYVMRDKQGDISSQDLEQLKKRLGDVMYYVATLAEYYDLQLSDIAEQNLKQSAQFKQARQTDA